MSRSIPEKPAGKEEEDLCSRVSSTLQDFFLAEGPSGLKKALEETRELAATLQKEMEANGENWDEEEKARSLNGLLAARAGLGDLAEVKRLLSLGASPLENLSKGEGLLGEFALRAPCIFGEWETFAAMLEHQESRPGERIPPLAFLEIGACCLQTPVNQGQEAQAQGQEESRRSDGAHLCLKTLLKSRMASDEKGGTKEILLLAACRGGMTAMAKTILEAGADPDTCSDSVASEGGALRAAMKPPQPELVAALLKHGATPDLIPAQSLLDPEILDTTETIATHGHGIWEKWEECVLLILKAYPQQSLQELRNNKEFPIDLPGRHEWLRNAIRNAWVQKMQASLPKTSKELHGQEI
jgi:hypothetical protein